MNIVNCHLTHRHHVGDILLFVKEVNCGVKRIILIRDNVSRGSYYTITFDTTDNVSLFYDEDESNDVSQLIINQIIASAISNITSTSIYVVNSDKLYLRNNICSIQTVRYFVTKGKEKGDTFLFVGKDKMSKLVAKLWGFKQAKLQHRLASGDVFAKS